MAFTALCLVLCASSLLLMSISPASSLASIGFSLEAGKTLYPGQSLAFGLILFEMQNNCDLTLKQKGKRPIWQTNTAGRAQNCQATLLYDGRLQIVDGNGIQVWINERVGREGARYVLKLLPPAKVQIFNPRNQVIWSINDQLF